MEVAGLTMLAILCWITYAAFHGPEPLPQRVPTHFGLSGKPDAWGSPQMLWLLPLIGAGLYLLMTVLGSVRFRRYNLPVRVTEANLSFIQEQTAVMVAWIKFEVLGLFTYIQWSIIEGARVGEFHLKPVSIPIFLVVIFATVGWHLSGIIRGARARLESSSAENQVQI